jgi:hypothetical protein
VKFRLYIFSAEAAIEWFKRYSKNENIYEKSSHCKTMKHRIPKELDDIGKRIQEIIQQRSPKMRVVQTYSPAFTPAPAISGSTGELREYKPRPAGWNAPYRQLSSSQYVVFATYPRSEPRTFTVDIEKGIITNEQG